MTTIGVMSDTHRDLPALKRGVLTAGKVDMWFHLGDVVSDAAYLREMTGLPVHNVRGNCDIRPQDHQEAQEMTLTVEGLRFLLCHGHLLRVKSSLSSLCARAQAVGAACALFGHTHSAEIQEIQGIYCVNPGSPSSPRGGLASIALLHCDEGHILPELRTI